MKKILLFVCLGALAGGCSTASNSKAQNESTTVSLFNGQKRDGWIDQENKGGAKGWTVTNGVIASTGAGRGTLYTTADFSHFRLTFLMRHVSGNKDHQACVLIFCRRPKDGEKPLDAIGGIQFQVPNGGHWDYRPGFNKGNPNNEFTNVVKPQFNIHEWSQVEIVADASTGTARMAVAQPPGGKAIEVLDFKDPAAGK